MVRCSFFPFHAAMIRTGRYNSKSGLASGHWERKMKAVAGSIVILAGAVIIAAGVIGQDICQASNRFRSYPSLSLYSPPGGRDQHNPVRASRLWPEAG